MPKNSMRTCTAAVALSLSLLSLAGCGLMASRDSPLPASATAGTREAAPSLAEAHYQAGRNFQASTQYAAAIESYQRALQRDPMHADAHNALGIIFMIQGREAEALAHFQAAATIEPQRPYLQANLRLARSVISAHKVQRDVAQAPKAAVAEPPKAAPLDAAGPEAQSEGEVRVVRVASNVYEMQYPVTQVGAPPAAPAARAVLPPPVAASVERVDTLRLRMATVLESWPAYAQRMRLGQPVASGKASDGPA
jgi:tetratricopeptide (TPR) repeat protein